MTVLWLGLLIAVLPSQDREVPETPEQWYALARSQALEGRLEEAEASFTRAIELNPMYPWPYYGLAGILRRQGRPNKALETISKAIEIARLTKLDGQEFLLMRADILFSLDRLDEAKADLEEVLTSRGQTVHAHHLLARIHMRQERYDDAMREGMALVRAGERVADGYFLIGKALFKKGNHANAEPALRKAILLRHGHPPSHYILSQVLMRLGREDEAEREGEIHKRLQRAKEEVEKLTRQGLGGTTAETWVRLAELYGELADYAWARHYIEMALKEKPEDPKVLTILGYILSMQKEYAEAIRTLRKAIEKRPDYALAYNNLAWILATVEEIRDPDEAVRLAEKAMELGSTRKGTLAEAYFSRGEVEKACEILQAAIDEGHPAAPYYKDQIKRFRESGSGGKDRRESEEGGDPPDGGSGRGPERDEE